MALKGMTRPETPAEVIARLTERTPGGCWIWLGSHSRGYAKMRWYEGEKRMNARVMRMVYELTTGPIPDGMELDHLCHQRGCVIPAHSQHVPHQQNIRRQRAHRRATVDVCENGHPYSTRYSTGIRYCHECKMEYQRKYRARRAS